MKNFIHVLCVLPGLLVAQNAQRKAPVSNAQVLLVNETVNTPAHITYPDGAAPAFADFKAIAKNTFSMRAEDDLKEYRVENDKIGFVHHRFQQTYNGYPVEFSTYIIHVKNGMIQSMNGLYYPEIAASNNISLKEDQALSSAITSIGASKYKWEFPEEEKRMAKALKKPDFTYKPTGQLVLYPLETEQGIQYKYAYKFDIYASEPLGRWDVYVDAQNGNVIAKQTKICQTDVLSSADTRYNGVVPIHTDSLESTPNTFVLFDATRGNGITTYNDNHSTTHGKVTDFTNTTRDWTTHDGSTDAHYAVEKTYDFYKSVIGRNSYDDQDGAMIAYVHYGTNYFNAFWDGSAMNFGDGSWGSGPLTSLDICSHEYSHGVTQYTAALLYQGESGGLNESFSDIMGKTVEFKTVAPADFSWKIGKSIGAVLRDMSNPKAYQNPDTYLGKYWINTKNCVPGSQNDNCGVHTNSGVQNKWFFLISDGGSGTNDIGSTYNVQGIGRDSAMKIAFRNQSVYLNAKSSYLDAAHFSIQSAIDLYGKGSNAVIQTTNAWYAVGIGKIYTSAPVASFNVDRVCSAGGNFQFFNKSSNADSLLWEFGDGQISHAFAPLHTYNTPGSYSVKLTVYNAFGKDSSYQKNLVNVATGSVKKTTCATHLDSPPNGSAGIFNFKLNTIDNTSASSQTEGAYVDFTCVRTELHADSSYKISITATPNVLTYIRVWLDFNNDGNLTKNEMIFKSDSVQGTHTGTISFTKMGVPDVPLRLRVMQGFVSNGDDLSMDCPSIGNGQFEDYGVTLIGTTSGISGLNALSQFSVYPNPTNGIVSVKVPAGFSKTSELSVYNLLGQPVFNTKNVNEVVNIDLSAQPKGVYFIHYNTEGRVYTQKVTLF